MHVCEAEARAAGPVWWRGQNSGRCRGLREVERRRAAGILKPEVPHKVRFAWRSLAMGDLNAVDFMTTGHLNLLRRHGAAREIMRYRSPVPKVPFKEGVIVDD